MIVIIFIQSSDFVQIKYTTINICLQYSRAPLTTYIIIAAIMSGVALGSQSCLYSDAIFMVSAGTGVSNTGQFEVVLPYTIIGAAFAAILFLVVGIRLAM